MAAITETYPSYAAALATCGEGYEAADIARVIAARTAWLAGRLPGTELHPDYWTLLVMALGLARHRQPATEPLRVLDLGGACGLHYLCARALLPGVAVRWAVVETPATAAAGRGLALAAPEELSFHTTLEAALEALGGCTVVHASGVVPYLPEPEAMLARLTALGAPWLVLGRFPTWHGATAIGVQSAPLRDHGPGPMPPGIPDRTVRYPVTFLPRELVLRVLEAGRRRVVEVPSTTRYTLGGVELPGSSLLLYHPFPAPELSGQETAAIGPMECT